MKDASIGSVISFHVHPFRVLAVARGAFQVEPIVVLPAWNFSPVAFPELCTDLATHFSLSGWSFVEALFLE